MRRLLAALLIGILPGGAALAEPLTYRLDPDHTEVRFYWDHAGVSEQSAEWGRVEGGVRLDADRIEEAQVRVTIDPASVNSGVASIDRFLTGPDMFDAARFPSIEFVSTSIERTGEETARIRGDLTIKGRTEPIILDVRLTHQGSHPLSVFLSELRGEWLGISATGRIFRSLFDLGYGFPLIADTIRLEISAELQAQ